MARPRAVFRLVHKLITVAYTTEMGLESNTSPR